MGGQGNIVYGHLEAGAPETVDEAEQRIGAPGITVVADGELRRLTPSTGDALAEGTLQMKAHTMEVGDLKSAGADVVLEAAQDVVADLAHAKRDLKITAGNDMRIGEMNYGGETSLVAGNNLWAKVGHDITFATAEVGGNAELYSGGNIAFDSLKAGGLVNLEAAGDVAIDDFVEAGESIVVVSGGDATIGSLTSQAGSITVQAAGSVTIDSLAAAQGFVEATSGADLRIDTVTAVTGSFDAAEALHLGEAHIGERLDLSGQAVTAKVFQTKPLDPFVLNLTGHAGGLADVAEVHVTSNSEVAFGRVWGKRVGLRTTSDRVRIDDAYVPQVLTME
ncbi:MAG: hypothetical protein IRY96_10520, partial [Burkholderiales bacterium]|nr:hypothetical protein [Burkholderiales bacterium]